MIVTCLCYGSGYDYACSVHLTFYEFIRTACHIFLRWTLRVISLMRTGANLLVRSFLCTQRKLISVILILYSSDSNLYELMNVHKYHQVNWNACDESHQLLWFLDPHPNDPIGVVSWGKQCPPQEVNGIVESEHVVIIFHVIFGQQDVNLDDDYTQNSHLFCYVVVAEIHLTPLKTVQQRISILFHQR